MTFFISWLAPFSFRSVQKSIAQWLAFFIRHVWPLNIQMYWINFSRNYDDCEKGFTQTNAIEQTKNIGQQEDDYTTAYDGSKILRKNRIHRVSQAQGTYISAGISGIVERLKDGSVQKSPHIDDDSSYADIEMEAKMYRLLGPHDRLVPYLGHSPVGLRLKYMENGNLREYLKQHKDIPMKQKLQWVQQAAEGLQLLHSNGIIHCDTKPSNFLLDESLNLKIADFSGSCFKGFQSHACESTRYYLPRDWKDPPNVATDLFALGSTMYEVFTGISPYKELASHDVERLYLRKEFPDVSGLPHGEIILKCWLCRFDSAQEISDSIKARSAID